MHLIVMFCFVSFSLLGPGTFPQLLFVFCEISIFEDCSPSPALCPTVTECSSNCDGLIRYKLCILVEKEMATHSSILAWKIPWMEEPGGLPSMGSQRVGHDGATSLSLSFTMHSWLQ